MIRRRISVVVAAALLLVFGVASASGAQTASWTWSAPVPHELAQAGDFTLVATTRGGQVMVGAEGQTPTTLAATEPVVAYTAATTDGAGQAIVGVVRADVDRVTAVLADGTQSDLPLNEWRGFSYVSSSSDRAAIEVDAFANGTPVGALAIPPTASGGTTATRTIATAVAAAPGYTISNPGKKVASNVRSPFFDHRYTYDLYLLGTIAGRAFYRVEVTPHYRCWAEGSASTIGTIASLGCPTVVGAYPLQLDDNAVRIAKPKAPPTYLRIDGLVADGAVKADLRDDKGNTVASTPVRNNLFSFSPPFPKAFVHVVPVDAQGNDMLPHPERGQRQQEPPFLYGARAVRVEPSQLRDALQHGQSRGVDVTVGRNSVVVVKTVAADAATKRRISDRNTRISCFAVSTTIRHTRGAGVSFTWAGQTEMAFKILGYIKPPFDACDIAGTNGHRWRDQWGTHSPVEIALTARGRWYFENRATARDLSLFVRSRDMQRLRKLHGNALAAAIRSTYGDRVALLTSATASAPPGTVGVWAGAAKTIISERSHANGRFYVAIVEGKIVEENVRGLAVVF